MNRIKRKKPVRKLRHSLKDPKKFIFQKNLLHWILVIVCFSFIYFLFSSSFFRIKTIECSSADDSPCDENVTAELSTHKNQLIFTTNTQAIEDKIKKANPIYSGVEISLMLPDILKAKMNKRNYFANLKISTNSASLIVDQNQIVVDKKPKPTPGTFTIISNSAKNYSVGDKISDQSTLIAFKIADSLRRNYLSFNQIYYLSKNEIIINLSNDKTAIITSTEDISRQVTSLQLILSKATISPEPKVYDMRFDMPVLKY